LSFTETTQAALLNRSVLFQLYRPKFPYIMSLIFKTETHKFMLFNLASAW